MPIYTATDIKLTGAKETVRERISGAVMWHVPQDMDSSLPKSVLWALRKPVLELK